MTSLLSGALLSVFFIIFACRYHARRQARFDLGANMIGIATYLTMISSVYKDHGGYAALLPLGLASACLWPPFFQAFNTELYYKWRDVGFIIQ